MHKSKRSVGASPVPSHAFRKAGQAGAKVLSKDLERLRALLSHGVICRQIKGGPHYPAGLQTYTLTSNVPAERLLGFLQRKLGADFSSFNDTDPKLYPAFLEAQKRGMVTLAFHDSVTLGAAPEFYG